MKIAEEWEFGRFFVGWMFRLVEIKVEGETDGVGGSGGLRVRSVVVVGMFGSWDGKGGSRRLVLRSQREGLDCWGSRRRRMDGRRKEGGGGEIEEE